MGKYRKFPFREQALIKSHWEGWRETWFSGVHLCVPFSLLPRGQEGVMLSVRTPEAAGCSSDLVDLSSMADNVPYTTCVPSLGKASSTSEPGTPSILRFFIKKKKRLLPASHSRC